ncbi:metal ABC transporter solute-binding protein, Zn/Mn family [uncultured Secundilactobacillus sp.]|uniref:metal ABC transporter solute-binding protein, Zn/Mn family n=1 Tax=uncultured Secundilactobacillus sp. TaxID=2813935 RepID=UPI002583094C|nr:zinc ABC transporter substrate-binding protein [uncultured Secundilactobacillus sp.]
MTRFQHFVLTGFGLMFIGLFLVSCAPKPHHASHRIEVVSSLDFYGEVAQSVVGDKGHVTSIINRPSIEPHEYEPTTNTAKIVSDADVVIYNGLGYDDWMPRLAADNRAATQVNVAQSIAHKQNGANEHLWYNTQTMSHLAIYLARVFSRDQPKNKAIFQANARHYQQSLQPIERLVNQLKRGSHGQLVNASEPVFDYALTAMGYKINNNHFAQAVQNDTDPSPKDIQQMDRDIKTHKIAFFVLNAQETNEITDGIVKQCHRFDIPVLKVTESKPAGKTYQQWMLAQYQALAKIQAR